MTQPGRILQGSGGALLLATLAAPQLAWAQTQAWVPEKGHGTVAVAYQQSHIKWHVDPHGHKFDLGQVDTRSALLSLDYGLSDKLALNVGLPFKSGRYRGRSPHDPDRDLDNDHGQDLMDDGRHHGKWGDWSLGLRYRWREDPWMVTPFVYVGYPSNDYPTFSHAAPGYGIWSITAGVSLGRRLPPPMENAWIQGNYGYSWLERVVDRRISRSYLNLEAGYFFTSRFSARAFLHGQKVHNGFDQPEYRDANGIRRRDDHFFYHDVTMRTDFVNLGAGASYLINDDYALFANCSRSVWGENARLFDYVYTVGINRSF